MSSGKDLRAKEPQRTVNERKPSKHSGSRTVERRRRCLNERRGGCEKNSTSSQTSKASYEGEMTNRKSREAEEKVGRD